jgi:FAD:protein FMN transferase
MDPTPTGVVSRPAHEPGVARRCSCVLPTTDDSSAGSERGEPTLRHVVPVLGTVVRIRLADDLPDRVLHRMIAATCRWLHEVDALFSTDRSDSEISRLRRQEITVEECSAPVRTVLAACARLWDRTRGYFDVYAHGGLEPSGFVRGWAMEIASGRLAELGSSNHLLEAPGAVRMRGRPSPDRLWRIGVRYPWSADRASWTPGGTDLGVATVGPVDDRGRPVDPLSEAAPGALRQVTVAGSDLRPAVAYATAAMAMGGSGPRWLATLAEQGYESASVTVQGEALRSSGLPVPAVRPAQAHR